MFMRLAKYANVLRDKADDKGGGGGGGDDLLNGKPGGGGDDKGGKGDDKGGDDKGTPPKVEYPANWKDGLPDELKNDASLGVIHDIPSLAKSFIHAQKAIGADKVVLPGKHATEEDWANFFAKVGAPKEAKDMELKLPEKGTIDEEFVGAFKEAAVKAGLLPKQAQKLVDWFNEANGGKLAQLQEKAKEAEKKALDGLKSEWGQSFDKKLNEANLALAHLDPQGEIPKILKAAGLQNNASLLRVFAAVGESLREDGTIKGDTDNTMTPGEASKQVSAIFADPNHPYFVKDHPGHRQAVEEVQKLMSYQHRA